MFFSLELYLSTYIHSHTHTPFCGSSLSVNYVDMCVLHTHTSFEAPAPASLPLRIPISHHNLEPVDDLGFGDLGFTGHPTVQTPNIDALANGGKILTSWYSGCPVCSGSRAALMTGRQFTRVGVPGVFGDSSTTGLPLNETTVADQLKKAGYATAIMGKW